MKKKIIILTTIIIFLFLGIYIYTNSIEYEYTCFNKRTILGTYIEESYLDVCTTKEKLPEGVITDTSELLSNDKTKIYKQTNSSYEIGDILYKKDFILFDRENIETIDIEFITETETYTTAKIENGLPVETLDEKIYYKIYIKDKKIYATNLDSKEEKIIFDTEEVKNMAIRPYCCAGNAKLLIITTSGNVYISKYDSRYFFSFDFPFEKLAAEDITSFKLIAKYDNDVVKSLYGINSKGEEILITEPEW